MARQLRLIHDELELELAGRYLMPSRSGNGLLSAFPNNSHTSVKLRFDL